MAAAGHMNIELPARTLLEEEILPKLEMNSKPTSMMTLPTGAPSAVMSKKTLTVAIVLRIGWIRVDSEDASVELLEGRGRVKPAERPRLASKLEIRPPGKTDRKSCRLEGWSEEAGAEQYSRSGAQGGAKMLSWKIHTKKIFAVEQCIKYNLSSTFRSSPAVAKPKIYFFLKNCLGTSLAHHDQWKQSTLPWPAYPRRLLERSQILGNDNTQQFFFQVRRG